MASRPAPQPPAWRRNVVRLGLHLLARVGHGDRESALAHHGKIDDVVADVGDLVERHAFLLP